MPRVTGNVTAKNSDRQGNVGGLLHNGTAEYLKKLKTRLILAESWDKLLFLLFPCLTFIMKSPPTGNTYGD